jgi:muramoyltetrapeptide carboxypeptidase LdcA involved in peptidoglycan recycling
MTTFKQIVLLIEKFNFKVLEVPVLVSHDLCHGTAFHVLPAHEKLEIKKRDKEHINISFLFLQCLC